LVEDGEGPRKEAMQFWIGLSMDMAI
jgi:hypothetical protein